MDAQGQSTLVQESRPSEIGLHLLVSAARHLGRRLLSRERWFGNVVHWQSYADFFQSATNGDASVS